MALDYTYAVGRIRVLETKFLDRDRIERMISAISADEALRVLSETAYGSTAAQIKAEEYEIMLGVRLKEAYDLVRHISPTPEVADMLALKYDFHNLKVLLKDRYLNRQDDDMLMQGGIIAPEKLKAMVQEGSYDDMPDALKDGLVRAETAFDASRDPQDIDIALDNGYYEAVFAMADKLRSHFLKELFIRQIDMINIRTLMRVKRMGRDSRFLDKVLLTGGYLDKAFFQGMLDQPLAALADRLRFTPYASVADGVVEFERTGRLTVYEKLMDDSLLAYIRDHRSDPFGLAAVVGYLWAVENETRIIRIIMVGKINHMPPDVIRQRVREVY